MNVKLLRAEWRAVRRASLKLMHHSLSMVGLLSVGVVGIVATHPEYAHAVGGWIVPQATPPFTAEAAPLPLLPAQPDPLAGAIAHPGGEAGRLLGLVVPDAAKSPAVPDATMTKVSATPARTTMNREQREVTTYLSKKYRINSDAIAMLVDAAYVTGKDLGLDPLLLLSVMGVESGFNPFAESTAGASGLMQLMSKVHRDKLNDFGGANIALNPVVNLRVGAVVLKDCIRRGGSIADGLRLYVGAGMGDDSGYGTRVLQEKDKLAQAVRATPTRAASREVVAPKREPKVDDKFELPPADQAIDLDHGRFDHGRLAAL